MPNNTMHRIPSSKSWIFFSLFRPSWSGTIPRYDGQVLRVQLERPLLREYYERAYKSGREAVFDGLVVDVPLGGTGLDHIIDVFRGMLRVAPVAHSRLNAVQLDDELAPSVVVSSSSFASQGLLSYDYH